MLVAHWGARLEGRASRRAVFASALGGAEWQRGSTTQPYHQVQVAGRWWVCDQHVGWVTALSRRGIPCLQRGRAWVQATSAPVARPHTPGH